MRLTAIVSNNKTVRVSQSKRQSDIRLDQLTDVLEGFNPQSGATLVYNPENDKYEIDRLTISDIDGDLDGGTF